MGMNLFTGEGQSKRCLLQEAQRHDFEMISSILKDNIDAIQLQGQDEQPITLAQSLIDHSDLPPQGQPCQEKTLLILTQATKTVIGMVSFYQGYPTEKTLYIGSLFFKNKTHCKMTRDH